MTLITVSIGNSSVRAATFAGDPDDSWPSPKTATVRATSNIIAGEDSFDSLLDELLADRDDRPLCWRVASVHRPAEAKLAAWVGQHRAADNYHRLGCRELPLVVAVDQPDRVGMDRLVAAVAANRIRDPQRPAIVVDAGSAVTVDLVDVAGAFQGGVILPGLAMTARALSVDTDALPLVDFTPGAEPPPVVGKATEAAIRSGLFWGTVGAVREAISQVSRQLGAAPQVLVTGGDARRMVPLLNNEAQYIEHLVPAGIALATWERTIKI